jgi:hypothetical protein
MGFKTRRLDQPVNIESMNGKRGTPITHAAWQKQTMKAENGTREFTVKCIVANIPEGMVLGRSWLGYANPDINWTTGSMRWRSYRKVLRARRVGRQGRLCKARQQVIQGAIDYNEAPD